MEVQILVNIVILCVVGVFCIVVIAVRIYVSCCRPQSEASDFDDIRQIVPPDIQVRQEDLNWTQGDRKIDKKEVCSICLDQRVNTVTNCKHYFHMNCLIEWKKRMKNACPYCKSEDLRNINFYCHHCTKSKFSYLFESPSSYQRSHMIPTFFIQFLTSQRRLLCTHCKDTQTQLYQECITRNFSSVRDTVSRQNSNKTSRDIAEIQIKTPKHSRQIYSNGDIACFPNGIMGPSTDNRMLIAIDY